MRKVFMMVILVVFLIAPLMVNAEQVIDYTNAEEQLYTAVFYINVAGINFTIEFDEKARFYDGIWGQTCIINCEFEGVFYERKFVFVRGNGLIMIYEIGFFALYDDGSLIQITDDAMRLQKYE